MLPGDSTNSLLFRKLEGTQPCGNRMPNGGPYWNATQIDVVRDWIDEGAQNN